MTQETEVLLVGNPEPQHVGAHFAEALTSLAIPFHFCNIRKSETKNLAVEKFNWWFRGHRPANLRKFSAQVVEACKETRPRWLLAIGLAPLDGRALTEIGELGIRRAVFVTDDPWNPSHRCPWFLKGLKQYDHIFTPRHSNLNDFASFGCRQVTYLPFAYSPTKHVPAEAITSEEKTRYACEVLFVGAADRDRVPYATALIEAGLQVGLYGGYWNRYASTRKRDLGYLFPEQIPKAVTASAISLCLVRRANRDGHSMRSFELPAMGACLLVEETNEHRTIFGGENEAVTYFSSLEEMVRKAKWLMENPSERARLSAACRSRILQGSHTYRDRLVSIREQVQTLGDVPLLARG